mgnify:CR=1 FL=1
MQGVNLLDPAAVTARDTICGSDHDVEILTLSDPTESLENRWAVRDGWKLILNTSGTKELYRLYNGSTPVDPHERNNLASSNTTATACRYAKDCEKLGLDGLMVLPAMVYKSDPRETLTHFRTVSPLIPFLAREDAAASRIVPISPFTSSVAPRAGAVSPFLTGHPQP